MIAYEEFPKNRAGHSMHLVGETLIIWGGCYLDIKCFDDLYMFDIRCCVFYTLRMKTWSFPKTFGFPPAPRTGHASFINGARIYIFGGTTVKGLQSDLHVFDLESVFEWTSFEREVGINCSGRVYHRVLDRGIRWS